MRSWELGGKEEGEEELGFTCAAGKNVSYYF